MPRGRRRIQALPVVSHTNVICSVSLLNIRKLHELCANKPERSLMAIRGDENYWKRGKTITDWLDYMWAEWNVTVDWQNHKLVERIHAFIQWSFLIRQVFDNFAVKSLIFSFLTYLGFRRMRLVIFPRVLGSFFPYIGGIYRDEMT